MIHSGFRLVTIANDSGLMAKAARESVAGVWAEAVGYCPHAATKTKTCKKDKGRKCIWYASVSVCYAVFAK